MSWAIGHLQNHELSALSFSPAAQIHLAVCRTCLAKVEDHFASREAPPQTWLLEAQSLYTNQHLNSDFTSSDWIPQLNAASIQSP